MASPHVAGVAALYKQANPSASATTTRNAIVNNATTNVVTNPGTGSVDGVMGDHLKLTPPLVLSRTEADEIVAALDGALGAVEARV